MWTPHIETHDSFQVITLDRGNVPATMSDVFEGWRGDREFRTLFTSSLSSSPFSAFRWEMPPVTADRLGDPFECVLLDDPHLDRTPDQVAFADFFRDDRDVVAFLNLSGDATLVAPCPNGPHPAYVHLAAFLRDAPERQVHALWQCIAEQVGISIGVKPFWLSTAGAGVAWLHVRFDQRPKYYGHRPYRNPAYRAQRK